MSERKSPSKSATLYKVNTKKKGIDGNMWIVILDKNKIKRWSLFKKVSKKNSKKVSKKVSKPVVRRTNYSIPYTYSLFSQGDYSTLEAIKKYKNIYEMILHKSLEYKIELTPSNYVQGDSNVTYFKKGSYGFSTSPDITVKMHIVGYLDGDTFTWNDYQRTQHRNTFNQTVAPSIDNLNTLSTLSKLFSQQQITFPEKYRQTIPYLISYMYDPYKANLIRFTDDPYTGHHYTYVFIYMSLDIPYWYQITDTIIHELNASGYYGGSEKIKPSELRIIKDDARSHRNKNYEKLYKSIDISDKKMD